MEDPIAAATIMIVFMFFNGPYQIPVLLGIWRASNRYPGSVLAGAAKVVTVLGWLWCSFILCAIVFFLLIVLGIVEFRMWS